MNKTELIEVVAKKTGQSKVAAGRCVQATIDSIAESLMRGKNVTLVGFGTFRVINRATRKGVNPQTHEFIEIRSAKVPRFAAGQALKKLVADA